MHLIQAKWRLLTFGRVHIKENKKLEALENDNTIREGDARGVGFRYVY